MRVIEDSNEITYKVPTSTVRYFPRSISVWGVRGDGVVVRDAIYFPISVIDIEESSRVTTIKVPKWLDDKKKNDSEFRVYEYK